MNPRPGTLAADRRALLILVVVSTVLRLIVVAGPIGFSTGDDVEVLETGLSPVTRIGYQPWAVRNPLLPRLLVTPVAALGQAVGLTDPLELVRLATLPFVVLAALNELLVFLLARRLLPAPVPVIAAGLYAFHWIPLAYGATVYPRTASTSCVLLAALLVCGGERLVARGLAAGGLMALAFAFRYSEAIFLLPLASMPWLLGHSRSDVLRRAVGLGAGFLVGSALTVGGVDLLAWGRPFASLVAFARYTLLERRSSSLVPHQPVLWYARRLPFWLLPPLLPFFFRRDDRRQATKALWPFVVLPLLILSVVHHGELRYLQGLLPFLSILLATGVAAWWRGRRKIVVILLLGISLAMSTHYGWAMLAKRSYAAVDAAQDLAVGRCSGSVVVRQAWAYGDRLVLGGRGRIVDFDSPPSAGELAAVLPGAAYAAFYASDLVRQPELRAALGAAGFVRTEVYSAWRSPRVEVWSHPERCPGAAGLGDPKARRPR